MARGKDGSTVISKQRLQLFKQLLDLQNDSKYLRSDGTVSSALTLANARTINGVSFNGASNVSNYGVCSTAASTAAKEVTIAGFVLGVGARATVLFQYKNTATAPTLSVSQTTATPITYNGAAPPEGIIEAGGIYEFIYDGTSFRMTSSGKNYEEFTAATNTDAGEAGLVPGPAAGDNTGKYLDATGNWSVPHDTTYTDFVPATTTSAGVSGLVPGPAVGDDDTKFLDATGHWVVPYSVFQGATATAAGWNGLVPAPPYTGYRTTLMNDGTWRNISYLEQTVDRYYHETEEYYAEGEVAHVLAFPTNYVLVAEEAGTTGATAPDFASYL